MNLEEQKNTREEIKIPEAKQEVPAVKPEELSEQMTKQSQKEVADFKNEGKNELENIEKGAVADGLTINESDKTELNGLDQEAEGAKDKLVAGISNKDESKEKIPVKDQSEVFEKANIVGIAKDDNFEGSIIIKTKDAEDRISGYAIRKNSQGDLEGNRIGYMKDGSIGPVYQLHESDFVELGKTGVLEKYENTLLQERDIDFARKEIQEGVVLEGFEKRAGDFFETLKRGTPSVEMAEKYENDYAIPAYHQAKRLKGIIDKNNSERVDSRSEKEKPFNSISSIVKDKKALCVHFLTGFSNANNKTGTSGIEVSSGDTFSKRSKEALKQLNTLAGLSPSISTSVFADSHNFDSTWCRDAGQPIGVILRDGECTEISTDDANSRSASPKSRKGWGEVATVEGINKMLSSEERKYSQSGYNEFIVSEPRIGALFATTDKPVEKECLNKLLQENEQFGYPLLFERKGRFYQIPREELEKLSQDSESNAVSVDEYLFDSREVSREDIRKSISTMEDDELKDNEKQRFDKYVENYELKPHFDWAAELESTVKTKNAYILDKEIKKNADHEQMLAKELETEGQLTKRLTEYFNKNNQLGKYWTEKNEYTYVNGEEYVGFDPIPDDAKVETKEVITEYWDYVETIVEPPAVADNIVGIGELSNFQTEIRRHLYVVKFPSGKIFQQSSEQTNIISKSIDRDGNERRKTAYGSSVEEEMELDNNEKVRRNFDHRLDMQTNFRPLFGSIEYGNNKGLIIGQDELENEIFNAKYVTDETRSKSSAYAFAMVEMCENDNDATEAEKWKSVALKISGSVERYKFVNSKLNNDGTLKLDNNDVVNL